MIDLIKERESVAQQLFRSDRAYFKAAAKRTRFDGGVLVFMPGLENVPAGCVVLPNLPLRSPRKFVREATVATSFSGAPLLRFYTPPLPKHISADLAEAGLSPTSEYAFICDAESSNRPAPAASLGEVSVRRVRGARGWLAKLELTSALEHLPDGKKAAAAQWTELERRKCEARYMEMWLLEWDGFVCGSFGLARSRSILRLKNLVIHPAARRLGLGRTTVAFALERARQLRLRWVGAFSLAGGGGSLLYTRCGFDVVGEQLEWSRPISRRAASPSSHVVKTGC